jgi:hypothetical protein
MSLLDKYLWHMQTTPTETTSKFGRPLTSNYNEIGSLIYDDKHSKDRQIRPQKHAYTGITTSISKASELYGLIFLFIFKRIPYVIFPLELEFFL